MAGRLPLYPLETTTALILLNVSTSSYGENRSSGLLGSVGGNCFPTFRRNMPPSSAALWVRELTRIHEGEGSKFLQDVGTKLPNHTAQQNRRPASSTIMQWQPQIIICVLLRIYFCLVVLSSSLFAFCCCVIHLLWKNEAIKLFIIPGRSRLGEKYSYSISIAKSLTN